MSEELIEYLIALIIKKAEDTKKERSNGKDSDFYQGISQAYYEVLDTIKNQLIGYDVDLKKYGLDVNLEDKFL